MSFLTAPHRAPLGTVMKPSRPLRVLLSPACSAALAAQAQGRLRRRSRRRPRHHLWRPMPASPAPSRCIADQLKGARSAGRGRTASPQALGRAAQGAAVSMRSRTTPARWWVVPQAAGQPSRLAGASRSKTPPQAATDAPITDIENRAGHRLSRIPRAQVERPAPITIVTAENIRPPASPACPTY